MSGEELKKKLKNAGISQAEIARRLGVVPQSVIQTLEAKDIKSGFIEDLCRVLNKDLAFFYDMPASSQNDEVARLRDEVARLQEENEQLKEELRMMKDPSLPKKESEVYRLWMELMKLSEQQMALSDRMRELYQKQKEE